MNLKRWLVLVVAVPALWAQCRAPYSVEQLESLLRAGVLQVRVRTLVEQCGLGFTMAPAVEQRLRQAGASQDVLDAAYRAQSAAVVAGPSDRASPESPTRVPRGPFGMEFVEIPAGVFTMGCGAREYDCMPQRQVSIVRSFQIGRWEVTQGQWEEVMQENPSRFKGAFRPVDSVSWHDAQAFMAALNELGDGYEYRLPTEAEWEYSARAGGDSGPQDAVGQFAWFAGNSKGQTQMAGRKAANAWGVHDMLGNVWEWCSGLYSPVIRLSDKADSQTVRGGSWEDGPARIRSSFRKRLPATNWGSTIGFRCVRERR